VTNLLHRLENGKGKPAYKAWIPVPILLPGEKQVPALNRGKVCMPVFTAFWMEKK